MRFTWEGREFDGPPVDEGLLAGFTVGELRWLKRELRTPGGIETLDAIEARIAYFVLAIRREDHTLLPVSRFDDLTVREFPLVPHVLTKADRDGDCLECGNSPAAQVHIPQDVEPDPTRAVHVEPIPMP